MPTTNPRRRSNLPTARLTTENRAALSDTVAHAATTALAVAGVLCPDPVRARNATALFPLAANIVQSGTGAEVRRRSGLVVALVDSAISADPSCRPLMLALERWLLHPGRDSADELTAAAAAYVATAPDGQLRAAWSVGAGLDAAVAEIVEVGVHSVGAATIAAVEEACAQGVSHTFVAQRSGVSRDAIYRRARITAGER
jgi:hypothetical protein